ncbi:MAG: glycosyltransferase family 2 protein [Pyrinomonadaceae bacterium]
MKNHLRGELNQTRRKSQIENGKTANRILAEDLAVADFRSQYKHETISWLTRKQSRFAALYDTSLYFWQTKGFVALSRHIYHFLKGERHNSGILPVTNSQIKSALIKNAAIEKALYGEWILKNEPDQLALNIQKQTERKFKYRPLISIITPVYNTDEIILEKMIRSVLAQTYSNWELCIAGGGSEKLYIRSLLSKYAQQDSRIKVKFLDNNLGISGNSNQAVEMAQGEFIGLLDHDDTLTPNALYENILLLEAHPDADIIYSDEDKIDLKDIRCHPLFKPDWSPDLLRSIMYTCHFGVYRTSLVKSVGNFRNGFDGSQDHDLVLRLMEKTSRIYHIPKILYHWRMTRGSTALNMQAKDYAEAARVRAVQEHCERSGLKGIAEAGLFNGAVRFKYLPENKPLVSIIIPTRDKPAILKQCLDSILKLSTYRNYEILVVDNNSSEQKTLDYFHLLKTRANVRVIKYSGEFNFSAINNFAAAQADGELLLFLNNDTEVISPDWLESMIEHAARADVGAVGARLLYPDKTIQHAGVIIGMGGVAGHAHLRLPHGNAGYFGRAKLIQNFSAVTGACLMTKAETFKSLNGFNERDLAIAFNDVDYCLRLRRENLLVVYTPYAELYHYESLSRGSDLDPNNIERFKREIKYMEDNWSEIIQRDPYYNPNLSLDLSLETFMFALPKHLANGK